MGMLLPDEEPEAGPWREIPILELVGHLRRAAGAPAGRPVVVAVDGRSASGKSTLAARLHAAVPRSAMVSTDDIAWHHSFFDWGDLLSTGVLEPVRRDEPVSYRPPAWDERGRAGAVQVPGGVELLLVEGVGAGRRALAPLVDVVVWVQADVQEAERRGLARDLATDDHGGPEHVLAFWHEWQAQERPFLADERPWDRASVIVAGTSPPPCEDGHVAVAPPVGARDASG